MLGFCSIPSDGGPRVCAALGEVFYNVTVTSAEMWQAAGLVLQRARLDRKWKPIDVERAGGPTYKTVQAIEDGRVGNVKNLEKFAEALQISLVDVLHGVLASRVTPLSPEAAQVVRKFAETTVAGRTALLAMANALPHGEPTPRPAPKPADAATPPKPGRSRSVPRGTTRRSGP